MFQRTLGLRIIFFDLFPSLSLQRYSKLYNLLFHNELIPARHGPEWQKCTEMFTARTFSAFNKPRTSSSSCQHTYIHETTALATMARTRANTETSTHHWGNLENQKVFLGMDWTVHELQCVSDRVALELGVSKPEHWCTVTLKQLKEQHAWSLLLIYGGSLFKTLQVYLHPIHHPKQ